MVSIDLRDAQSQLHGKRQAMYVMTKFNTSRFEFVFATDDESLFASVQASPKCRPASTPCPPRLITSDTSRLRPCTERTTPRGSSAT